MFISIFEIFKLIQIFFNFFHFHHFYYCDNFGKILLLKFIIIKIIIFKKN